jgi:ribosomal protein S18 acetylase RimI-like enzyme
MRIEQLGAKDISSLDALRRAYAAEMGAPGDADTAFTERLLSDPDVRVWGAFENSGLVGFAVVMELPDAIYRATYGVMDDLFVKEEARGRGIARSLINAILEHGRQRSWAHLRWLAPEEDKPAIALYDKIADHVALRSYIIRIDPTRSV